MDGSEPRHPSRHGPARPHSPQADNDVAAVQPQLAEQVVQVGFTLQVALDDGLRPREVEESLSPAHLFASDEDETQGEEDIRRPGQPSALT